MDSAALKLPTSKHKTSLHATTVLTAGGATYVIVMLMVELANRLRAGWPGLGRGPCRAPWGGMPVSLRRMQTAGLRHHHSTKTPGRPWRGFLACHLPGLAQNSGSWGVGGYSRLATDCCWQGVRSGPAVRGRAAWNAQGPGRPGARCRRGAAHLEDPARPLPASHGSSTGVAQQATWVRRQWGTRMGSPGRP